MEEENGVKPSGEVVLSRRPSWLDLPRGQRRSCSRTGNISRLSSTELSENAVDLSILQWDTDDIMAWLSEIDLSAYSEVFKEHEISSGQRLLLLTAEHLAEMGVRKVGDRLDLAAQIDELRKRAGRVSRSNFVDLPTLLQQLDLERNKRSLALYPKRIILLRHAESMGNVDKTVYASIPDNQLSLTANGISQAVRAGEALKELVGNQMVTFYVSPFLRSRLTYRHVRQAFLDEQVMYYREDPRLREQEWGNFQEPSAVEQAMKDRRKIGAFYYRFSTGESGADVFDRVSTFLETLYRDMQKGGCGENAIIVSHGLFCRLFLTRFYHWSVEKFHKMWNPGNCEHIIMELQQDGFYKLVANLHSDDDI